MKPLRIAVARLSHETNCNSPLPTTLADFERGHLLHGDAVLAAFAAGAHEVPHYLKRAELWGAMEAARKDGAVTVVPLMSAWSVPGGPLTPEAWRALSGQLLAALDAAGPVDGVLLVLHGALAVQGEAAPETWLIEAVKHRLGEGGSVAVALDLHAHLTPAKVAAADLIVAYKTNPHRDFVATGRRALTLLASSLRAQVRPVRAWRSLPMVLGGGTTVDLAPASAPMFRAMRRLGRRTGVLDVSVFVCHPWVGDPSPCWAVHVTTDGDQARADALADELAEVVWGVRHAEGPQPTHATEALSVVRKGRWRRRLGVAALVDTSDIVGAGAPGDHTGLLRALLAEAPELRAWVPLRDPAAVAQLHDGSVGDEVTLDVGGTWSDAAEHRVTVTGRLVHLGEALGLGRTATLDLGGPAIVLTEGPPMAFRPSFFEDAGLSVRRADVVVLKSILLWLPHFWTHATRRMLVRTRGPTDFDAILDGPFAHPVHPRDVVEDWRAHDRSVRGVP